MWDRQKRIYNWHINLVWSLNTVLEKSNRVPPTVTAMLPNAHQVGLLFYVTRLFSFFINVLCGCSVKMYYITPVRSFYVSVLFYVPHLRFPCFLWNHCEPIAWLMYWFLDFCPDRLMSGGCQIQDPISPSASSSELFRPKHMLLVLLYHHILLSSGALIITNPVILGNSLPVIRDTDIHITRVHLPHFVLSVCML